MKSNRKEINFLREKGKKKVHRERRFSEGILALLLAAGIFYALQDLAGMTLCTGAAVLAAGLVILLCQITAGRERLENIVKLGIYGICVLSFLVFARSVIAGFLGLVNRLAVLCNLRFNSEFGQFAGGNETGVGVLVLWGIFAAAAASFLLTQIRKHRMVSVLVPVLAAFIFEAVLGRSQSWTSLLLFLAGLAGMLIFYSAPERGFGIRIWLCAGGAVVVTVALVLVTSGYTQLSSLEQWKYNLVKEVRQIRYGEDTLPQGDLRAASGLLDGEEERLKIRMDSPEELYLRGYVGGDYEKTFWAPLSSSAYQGDYDGMMKWLEKRQFLPVLQYARYSDLTDQALSRTQQAETIRVENTGAYRKYLYLPASVNSFQQSGTKIVKDQQVQSAKFFGHSGYTFQLEGSAVTADTVILQNWLNQAEETEQTEYLEAESVYHSFVEDSYLTLTEEEKDLLTELFFPEEVPADFTDVTTQIRQVLRSTTLYTENPENVPEDQDQVIWFLTDYKKGNAVSYATAAALAYRAAGYPARYVEGYHLSAAEAQQLSDEGKTEAVLTTKNAHAWVEVYVAGAGWLPVEVVPGMYVESYTNQVIEGKAAYQVNSKTSEDGTDVSQGGSQGAQGTQENGSESTADKAGFLFLVAVLLLIGYLLFFCYVILKVIRKVRRSRRQQEKEQALRAGNGADYYAMEIERLLKRVGVRGDFTHPLELWEQVHTRLPGILEFEYTHAVEILQKARFGGIELQNYELRALDGYVEHLERALQSNHKWFKNREMR